MGKNVAVFVDVANIFYAAKAAGVDIDYVTLLKAASAGRDLVRAYAYTGLDPDNENQRNFHDFLRRSNYKVVSKDIRKYGDGKVKANLDIELVVDMMKTARNLDIAIVVSGDGDFAPAIRAVQEMGVRCEVISFRGNTSSDLIEVADQFTDITQLARVEKGTRSGRRVADADDLSMTEVPDKQTEGTGVGRGRGGRGGRGRSRSGDAEPVAASSRGRGRGRSSATNGSGPADREGLTALPGEKLSRAGGLSEADLASAEVFTLDDLDEGAEGTEGSEATADRDDAAREDDGRRRRRRGGRGRGRGRGREESVEAEAGATGRSRGASVVGDAGPADPDRDEEDVDEDVDEDEAAPVAPRGPRSTPFGSVWDSQLGTSTAPSTAGLGPIADEDEDFDEPEIPEYLIAEQRRGSQGRGGGGQGRAGQGRGGARGGRSAYQSAMERERFGRGGGGGINRYPDVSGRTGTPDRGGDRGRPPREERGGGGFGRRDDRPRDAAPRASSSSEPWSEVPPELEAMLRAQVGAKPAPAARDDADQAEAAQPAEALDASAAPETVEKPKRRTTRKAATTADASDDAADKPAPKRRTTRRTATTGAGDDATAPAGEGADEAAADKPAPKRRTTRKAAATTTAAGDEAGATGGDEAAADKPAPKRRTTRKPAARASDTD